MPRANFVSASYPDILRRGGATGTKFHQTDNGLLWVPPRVTSRFYSNGPMFGTGEGATIRNFEMQNRAAGACSMGIGFRLANRVWVAGTYDGTTYTDFTADVQSPTGTAILGTDEAEVGFAIGCIVPFDWVSVNITTAEVDAGAAVDHAVTYSDVAGTGWTAVNSATPLTDNFTLTDTVLTAAVKNFVCQKPIDWGASKGLTGLVDGYYWLYVSTAQNGAGDTAAVCTGIEIGIGKFREAFADNNIYASESEQITSPYADGLVAYFSTANAGNFVSALVEQG